MCIRDRSLVVTHIFETPFDKAPIPAPLPILPTIDNAGPATNVSPPVDVYKRQA